MKPPHQVPKMVLTPFPIFPLSFRSLLLAACLTFTLPIPTASISCTTFCFQHEGQWVFGRNYDWDVEAGFVMVNKRGVVKTSFTEDNPARWKAAYGSVTFNQYGREMPMGGMNEAGLVIECMWLNATEYPPVDARHSVTVLQWIQYQLDTAASVTDVIASDAKVRISNSRSSPIHFLICDRKGHCASIEYLSGEMVVHTGDNMPVTALTNNTYQLSREFLESCHGDETSEAFVSASHSLKRFFWAAQGVSHYVPGQSLFAVDYAFDILEKVSVGRTQWRVVYDVSSGGIYFRTLSHPEIRYIDFHAFDFSCDSPVTILDMASACHGDVSADFLEYSYKDNYNLIVTSFGQTDFLQNTPDDTLKWIARYPERFHCDR